MTVGALVALVVPLGAAADGRGDWNGTDRRVVFATDTEGNLLTFDTRSPRHARSKAITDLPTGVALSGIDFRPATGDLYALGSDKVGAGSISPRARRGGGSRPLSGAERHGGARRRQSETHRPGDSPLAVERSR